MDYFREQLDRLVYEQKDLLEKYTKEYSTCSKADSGAHLICCRNNGKDTYYRAYTVDGRYIRESLSKDKDAVSALARKEYLRIMIDELGTNIRILESSSGAVRDLSFDAIVSQMHKPYQGLPEESFFPNGTGCAGKLNEQDEDRFKRHREWAGKEYEKSSYMPEGRRYMTSGGFRVRSKSEQLIAEQIISYDVPFRYEQVIHIGKLSYSADFTFRDRNEELFYWEHAGMMDVPKYVDSYYRKMDAFDSVGIVPWKNLIVTYDMDGGISIPAIKSIIENEVIPRL